MCITVIHYAKYKMGQETVCLCVHMYFGWDVLGDSQLCLGESLEKRMLVSASVVSSSHWLGESGSLGMLVEKPGRAGKQREA